MGKNNQRRRGELNVLLSQQSGGQAPTRAVVAIWRRTNNGKDNRRSFDYGSRDEAARTSAQDDNFYPMTNSKPANKFKTYDDLRSGGD
jgi:hypothetical protein